MHLSGAAFRRLIPATAVGAVLVFSFIAQAPTLASSTNNCGVKGYGYHDHGKVCPNRPFPGKGEGIEKATGTGLSVGSKSDVHGGSKVLSPTTDATTDNSSGQTGAEDSASHGHGHANGHSKVHGQGNSHDAD